jgi:hypothetical protein
MGRTPTLSVAGMKSRIRRTAPHRAKHCGVVPNDRMMVDRQHLPIAHEDGY